MRFSSDLKTFNQSFKHKMLSSPWKAKPSTALRGYDNLLISGEQLVELRVS